MCLFVVVVGSECCVDETGCVVSVCMIDVEICLMTTKTMLLLYECNYTSMKNHYSQYYLLHNSISSCFHFKCMFVVFVNQKRE